jgi:hypothetical protein
MVDDVGIDAVHSPHFTSTPLILAEAALRAAVAGDEKE